MTDPVQPTVEQILAAVAGSLLPLAGPYGLAASALLPAVQQLYDNLVANPGKVYTVDDFALIVARGDAALAKLIADNARINPAP